MSGAFPRVWGRFRPPISWFPGHMRKATNDVQGLVKQCDLLIEVRDARVPVSSVNPTMEALPMRRLVVYNKLDLSDAAASAHLAQQSEHRGDGGDALFMSATSDASPVVKWLLREAAQARFKSAGSLVMVVGMPNVGKSTLINAVGSHLAWQSSSSSSSSSSKSVKQRPARRPRPGGGQSSGKSHKHMARVGAQPGVTRQTSSLLVCESPVVRLLDTPGIMTPKISSTEVGLRLALTGAIKDSIVGEEILVEYLIHLFHSHGLLDSLHQLVAGRGGRNSGAHTHASAVAAASSVVAVSGDATTHTPPPEHPLRDVDDVVDLVEHISGSAGKHDEERTRRACAYVLARWRAGDLGRYTLDHVYG